MSKSDNKSKQKNTNVDRNSPCITVNTSFDFLENPLF